MSQFEGNKLKVRCIDCTKLSGSKCMAKGASVAPKKKRVCGVYEFKGEYQNRTPIESEYMPHVDKKTRKMIQRLLKLGIIPVAEDGSVGMQDGFARTKSLPMPATTATRSQIVPKESEDPLIYSPSSHNPDDRLIWTPGDE